MDNKGLLVELYAGTPTWWEMSSRSYDVQAPASPVRETRVLQSDSRDCGTCAPALAIRASRCRV
jgi:hypothetical protein